MRYRVETSLARPFPRDHKRFPWRHTPANGGHHAVQSRFAGQLQFTGPVDEATILSVAEKIREARFYRENVHTHPAPHETIWSPNLPCWPHEVFAAIFLDNRHAVIAFEILFTGTLGGAPSIHAKSSSGTAPQRGRGDLRPQSPLGVPERASRRSITDELNAR